MTQTQVETPGIQIVAPIPQVSKQESADFARAVLDGMAIIDLVYHAMDYSEPLVVNILQRVANNTPPGGQVLVVGPNAYLAKVLAERGYTLEIWRFGDDYLTDDVGPFIAGHLTPMQMARRELPFTGTYDTIVLPLVLEHVLENPFALLVELRRYLSPNGCLVLASTNLGRFGSRLRALMGKGFLPDWKSQPQPGLAGWPTLPMYRPYQLSELAAWSQEAGYEVEDWRYELGQRAFSQAIPLTLLQYLVLKTKHGIKSAVPSLRDYIAMTLKPRQPEEELLPALIESDAPHGLGIGGHSLPMVSVVMPTHNRASLLKENLQALFQQSYPSDRIEIIIVNDGSTDETEQVIAAMLPEATCRVVVERTEGIGAAAARNAGMRAATGDIVAHTDDDCRVPRTWVESGVMGFERNVAIVAGPVEPKPELRFSFFSWTMSHATDNGTYPTSNIFYRRDLVLAEGGFDEQFGGNMLGRPVWGWDSDLAWRLQRKGYEVRFRPEARTYHHVYTQSPRRWLLEGWRASMLPGVLREVPEVRSRLLVGGLFLASNTALFELGIVSSVVAFLRKSPRWLLLWAPWVRFILGHLRLDWWPPTRWPRLAGKSGFLFGLHAITLVASVFGSLRARRLML